MGKKGFNQVRLIIGLIGFAMLIFLKISAVISVIDACIFGIGFAIFLLITGDLKYFPWTLILMVFYTALSFLGYHWPILVWNAPDWEMFPQVALYGNKLMILFVNSFLYFLAIVSLLLLVCAVLSGFGTFSKKDSSLK